MSEHKLSNFLTEIIDADLAARLAGPAAPGEFAEAQDAATVQPIGRVETLQGTVTASRIHGSTVTLEVDTAIFEGDVLETAEGATVGIIFVDDSTSRSIKTPA